MSEQQPPLYQIVDWNEHFENNRSRQISKCNFVYIPNRQGGLGVRTVLAEPDGLAIYGAWVLLLQLCSRQPQREGYLTQDGKENGLRLSAAQLARVWGRPVVEIYRMFQVISRPDVGWIIKLDGTHEWQERQSDVSRTSGGDADVRFNDAQVRSSETPENETTNGDASGVTKAQSGVTDRRSSDEERKKEGNCTPPITVHNATVMEGGVVNTLKVEEEMPWIDDLFETHEPWSCEELQLLSELLPIRPQAKKLLIWAYRQVPRNNPFHERTRLKQARLFLLREFSAEVQKIMSVRRELGLPAEIQEGKT